MVTLEHVLNLVRTNPSKFLTEKSLVLLHHFIRGIEVASPIVETDPDKIRFSRWITRKFGFSISRDAFTVISLIAHNEEDAFNRYFSEWDVFSKDHGDQAEKWMLSPLNRDWHVSLNLIHNRMEEVLLFRSVKYLRAVINGLDFSSGLCSAPNYQPGWQLNFESWLCRQNSWSAVYRWENVLTFLEGGDETKACESFFSHFRNFVSDTPSFLLP